MSEKVKKVLEWTSSFITNNPKKAVGIGLVVSLQALFTWFTFPNSKVKSEGKIFKYKNRDIEYFEFGSNDTKITILMIHGFLTSGKLWEIHEKMGKRK